MRISEIEAIGMNPAHQEILDSATEAGKFIEHEISDLFPGDNWSITAGLRKIIGYLFVVHFHETKYANNIVENANYRMKFTMHMRNEDNFVLELQQISSQLTNAGVVYRKIKGKTMQEVAKKFVMWMKKNKELILNSETPSMVVIMKKLLKAFNVPMKERKSGSNQVQLDRRAATALNKQPGETVILQDLSDDEILALAKLKYIL